MSTVETVRATIKQRELRLMVLTHRATPVFWVAPLPDLTDYDVAARHIADLRNSLHRVGIQSYLVLPHILQLS